MSNGPTLSIITVVWNAKADMARTLQSMAHQDLTDIEFVVIDGASNDGTLDVIDQYRELIDQLISEPDDGLYHAMNKGRERASGVFAAFINAGDIFVGPDVLSDLTARLRAEPTHVLCYGRTILHYADDYREAPSMHHQAVLFPKNFYTHEEFDDANFKIAAEVDYILRAQNQLETRDIEMPLVYSAFEGFGIMKYSTLAGTKQIHTENVQAMRRNGMAISFGYLLKSVFKFFAYKIGGQWLVSRMLFLSYPETVFDPESYAAERARISTGQAQAKDCQRGHQRGRC